jgi:hypothetical protein
MNEHELKALFSCLRDKCPSIPVVHVIRVIRVVAYFLLVGGTIPFSRM